MFPTDFDQSNFVFDKPGDMDRDECAALNTFRGQAADGTDVVISCWKPTREELDEINRTGRVWVWHYGNGLQPHAVSGLSPFEQRAEDQAP